MGKRKRNARIAYEDIHVRPKQSMVQDLMSEDRLDVGIGAEGEDPCCKFTLCIICIRRAKRSTAPVEQMVENLQGELVTIYEGKAGTNHGRHHSAKDE